MVNNGEDAESESGQGEEEKEEEKGKVMAMPWAVVVRDEGEVVFVRVVGGTGVIGVGKEGFGREKGLRRSRRLREDGWLGFVAATTAAAH